MTGFVHQQLELSVTTLGNVVVLHQNNGVKAGVTKTALITADYVQHTRNELDADQVRFDKNWISVSASAKSNGRHLILNKLYDQLLRFGYDENMRLSGKANGEQDDLVIAFMMLFYWTNAIYKVYMGNPYRGLLQGLV